ncbi:MAG: SRPBCC domain-containing protein [Nitrososphaerota archaeon]|nr:SRPBCC domain-containing protein [Nitrososphaerota archaeon]MDG6990938.1 SRPBCC domain-containing protein [Nitrososphaerota archaeon]
MTAGEQGVVKVTRIFEFPRESVFRMWTDPKKLAEWWGPEGCVNVRSEVDPRPGGKMRVDQRSPTGDISSFNATFEKVIPPELLVYRSASPGTTDEYGGFSPWEAIDTVTFAELGPRRTQVTAVTKVIAGRLEERETLMDAYREGWGQSLDKLQRALR